MTKILVTGGTGTLGRQVVQRLESGGMFVRSFSRHMSVRKNYELVGNRVEWSQGDLETGRGLDEALKDIDVVIHTATGNGKSPRVDIEGTRILLAKARKAGVSHFIYISLVGADRIPVGYFRTKLEAEELVTSSGIPWSILRATQFHSLLDGMLHSATRVPLFAFLPTFVNQPVDSSEVADRLCELALSIPSGRVPDLGGPEVLTGIQILHTWLNTRRMKRLTIPIYIPGKMGHALRSGYTTCLTDSSSRGKITWSEWVDSKYFHRKQKVPQQLWE